MNQVGIAYNITLLLTGLAIYGKKKSAA